MYIIAHCNTLYNIDIANVIFSNSNSTINGNTVSVKKKKKKRYLLIGINIYKYIRTFLISENLTRRHDFPHTRVRARQTSCRTTQPYHSVYPVDAYVAAKQCYTPKNSTWRIAGIYDRLDLDIFNN